MLYKSKWGHIWEWFRNTYIVKFGMEILMMMLTCTLVVAFVM